MCNSFGHNAMQFLSQVAMCKIFTMVIKQIPSYSEHVSSLLQLACIPEIVSALSDCIQVALENLGLENVAGAVGEAPTSKEAQAPLNTTDGIDCILLILSLILFLTLVFSHVLPDRYLFVNPLSVFPSFARYEHSGCSRK